MKLKIPGLKMSKETKQTVIGGLTAGLIFHMEQAAKELVTGYPQVLIDPLAPGMPRNGQLLATAGPVGVMWALPKIRKRESARMRNIKMGVTFYDVPGLLHQVVRYAAYQAGVNLRLQAQGPVRLALSPANGSSAYAQRVVVKPPQTIARPVSMTVNRAVATPVGKFRVTASTKPTSMPSSGIGKYKLV